MWGMQEVNDSVYEACLFVYNKHVELYDTKCTEGINYSFELFSGFTFFNFYTQIAELFS